jgi:isoamylase
MRNARKRLPLLVIVASLLLPVTFAQAEIDTQHLGARYDTAKTNITFRVYSSRATRVELDLYAVNYGAPDVATYVLTKDADHV